MKLIKRTGSHAIYQRRDGRYAVRSNRNKAVNGDEKVQVLLAEGLLTAAVAKAAEPAAEAEEAATETTEAEQAAQEDGAE